MRTPALFRRPWTARAAFVAAAAVIIAVAHQGMATAGTGPSSIPANPLAHLVCTPIHDQQYNANNHKDGQP